MPATNGLHVTDLRFAYSGEGFRVHVPLLELAAGKALALAGPSGAGKSTLLRLFTGLLTPTAGKVSLGATDLHAMTVEARRAFRLQQIGLVFQDFALLDYLTVTENICCRISSGAMWVRLPAARCRHSPSGCTLTAT